MFRTRTALPSWLISMLLHVVLVLLLGLTLRLAPPRGAAAERTAEVGIVLKHQDGGQEFYQGEEDAGGGEAGAAAATTAGSVPDLFNGQQPSAPRTPPPSSR